jgi:DNA-binding NtrC family response regulator
LKKKTVLLVDDDLDFRRALKKVLERSGHKAATACDGQEAIDFLSEYAIDLVISEVRMPQLCGIELMEQVKRRRIGTPVIFLTAYGEVESYMDLMNMGAFEYLNKPVEEEEVLRVAQKAMGIQSNTALFCEQNNCQE